jgi:lipopolysaccharide/colanic/teichoic acid biosynthesis glycosyltransferase
VNRPADSCPKVADAAAGPTDLPAAAPHPGGASVAPLPAGAGKLTTEVVLLTHNSEADLARSLPAVQEAAGVAGAQLLFVDLGSEDGTRSFAARHAPGARGIWLEDGDGLADALTAAAACSDADVLVVLRPTVQPSSPDAIAQLVQHLDEHPYAAVVAPTLRAHTGAVLDTADSAAEVEEFRRVEWVVSEAIALRRADVYACAGGRRVPRHIFEQLELCIKLRARGREIHYLCSVEWADVGGRAARRLNRSQQGLSLRAWRLLLAHPSYALRLVGRHSATSLVSPLLRRTLDVGVSALLLLLLAPVLVAIALAVRIDSRGPALFRQRRLGHGARPFQMYKFRTMRHGSDPAVHKRFVREMIVNELQAKDSAPVSVFKVHPDPRVTRIGRALRRTSLDELPQLFNILRGDMSLIGFRPPIPYEVRDYPAWYHRRFDGQPGLTGLWQVSGRNRRSYDEMVLLDIEYLNRRSWVQDLIVLIRTVGVVITGRGAY